MALVPQSSKPFIGLTPVGPVGQQTQWIRTTDILRIVPHSGIGSEIYVVGLPNVYLMIVQETIPSILTAIGAIETVK